MTTERLIHEGEDRRERKQVRRLVEAVNKRFAERRVKFKDADEQTVILLLSVIKNARRVWEEIVGNSPPGRVKEFYEQQMAALDSIETQIRWATWGGQISLAEYIDGEQQEEGEGG